jgi:predicted O-methyltransferase YrrM
VTRRRSSDGAQAWSQFHNVLGLTSLGRRLDILRRSYLNHRFDRRSPLPLIDPQLLTHIYGVEVVLPPRHYLMQPGAQTIDGLFFLASLAVILRARTLFEIGTFTGVTTWTLSRNVPDAVVHTLDIPPDVVPRWELEADDVHRASRNDLLYLQLPPSGDIVQHWSDSATFAFERFYDVVDLVYVDGAHSEAYVRSDTEHALGMISPVGAVVWDDYWRLSPGVVKVLHERDDLSLCRVPGTRFVTYLSDGALRRISAGDATSPPEAGEGA